MQPNRGGDQGDEPFERAHTGCERAIVRASNDQHDDADPIVEFADDECEGVAQSLLTRIGAEQHPTPLAAFGVARALKLNLSPAVPSGCRSLLAADSWSLRYDGRGEPETVNARLAHELGHYATARAQMGRLHPEASIERIASAIVLPRAAVRLALRRVTFDPLRLLAELPGPPPAWVVLRAAWVDERPVVIYLGRERWAYAPDGRPAPMPGAWERGMLEIVRRTGRPYRTLLGDEAWPVGFREHLGAVILPAE